MTALDRWDVRCAVVVCVFCLAVVGGLSGAAVAQTTETANETTTETVQHERPESASESGDADQLRRWLGNRLDEQLGSSTAALSEGEYDRARELLGDDYDGRLAQYVDVADDTEGGDGAGDTYGEVRDSQRELATQAQRFEAASERYERARENGNTTAAREAAREMNRLGDEIRDTGSNTTAGYRSLETQTGTDTSEQRAVVTNLTANVRERQEAVRNATFVETELAVVESTRKISFRDPLELTGRLTTANDSAVANRTIRIEVAGRAQRVTTDADGEFNLSYRPRTLRADAASVPLAYLPRNDSVYLGSDAGVPVDVTQVEPTLRIRDHTDRTAFGDPVGATVVLTVDGQSVGGVPLAAEMATVRLGRSITDATGSAQIRAQLPATPTAGDHQLRAAFPLENRAIAPADATAPVTVATTETRLNVTGDRQGPTATVTGRLVTADGRPVATRTVQVTRNDTAVTTVETGPDGGYSASVPLAAQDEAVTGPVRVAVAFDGTGTNLDASDASTTVTTDGTQAGGESPRQSLPFGGYLVAVAGVLVVLGGGWAVWRRRREEDAPVDDGPAPDPVAPTETGATGTTRSAIERAETFLDRGAAGAAVRAAYAAVRERYEPAASADTVAELRATATDLDETDRRAVDQVTSAYEHEAFAPGTVDEGGARAAVDAAGELIDHPR